jgi:hypothetical protein
MTNRRKNKQTNQNIPSGFLEYIKFYISFNFTPLRLLSPMTLLLNYILGCEITIVANCNYAGNYIVSQ